MTARIDPGGGGASPAEPRPQARPTTGELCAAAEVSEDAKKLAADDILPRAFVTLLVEKELLADAVRFIAHALPKREAVWWAWVCARKAAAVSKSTATMPDPSPKVVAALAATERWIVQPTDDLRRGAFAAGEAAEFSTAAGCAALAAFLSGGSVAPAHLPAVAPGDYTSAKAVAGGVSLAAATGAADQMADRFREYISLGVEVADRTKLWPESLATPANK